MYAMRSLAERMQFVLPKIIVLSASVQLALREIPFQTLDALLPHLVKDVLRQPFVKLDQTVPSVNARMVLLVIHKQPDAIRLELVRMETVTVQQPHPVLTDDVLTSVTMPVDQIWSVNSNIQTLFVCVPTSSDSCQTKPVTDVFVTVRHVPWTLNVMVAFAIRVNVRWLVAMRMTVPKTNVV